MVLIPCIIRDSFSYELLYPFDPHQWAFQVIWINPVIPDRTRCIAGIASQVALRDSLKSILHAGYPRSNPFIGDYSSAFRQKDRRNEDWKYSILADASKKLALLSLIFLLFREWRASNYRKERITYRACLHLISLEILFIFRYFSCICMPVESNKS